LLPEACGQVLLAAGKSTIERARHAQSGILHDALLQMGGNEAGTRRTIKLVPHAAQQCGKDGRERMSELNLQGIFFGVLDTLIQPVWRPSRMVRE
jgi:hypothetical protein